ncbi:hypothetical protein [Brevundimonas sp. SL130]|uniref:hypothetical protein n=1 Tax=Brevundimonas sp. SL130 TaxID=2995143 RepID=UPI00226D2A92|nr:hypothetical protein [Brevundimonas sp. SL130]WAC59618.1 hypothetical protein OU998_15590 [Brevundimonas sp. SL130]
MNVKKISLTIAINVVAIVTCAQVVAQDVASAIKPLLPVTRDENGVDIVSGSIFFEHTLSMPAANAGNPVFQLIYRSSSNIESAWGNNLTTSVGCYLNPDEWEMYEKQFVSVDGQSEIIDLSTEGVSSDVPIPPHPQPVPVVRPIPTDAGTLSQSALPPYHLEYIRRDGMRAVFLANWNADTDCYESEDAYYIVRPNGERLTFDYDSPSIIYRSFVTVTSSAGYQLRLRIRRRSQDEMCVPYDAKGWTCLLSATLIRTAEENCPLVAECTYGRVWPSLRVGYVGASKIILSDEAGRQTTYTVTEGTGGRLNGWLRRVITAVNYPDGRVRTFSYRTARSLPGEPLGSTSTISTVNEGGAQWSYLWASDFPPEWKDTLWGLYAGTRTVIDPTGRSWAYKIGYGGRADYGIGRNYLVSARDDAGRITSYDWFGYHNPVLKRVTFPSGKRVEYTYDVRRNIVSEKEFSTDGSFIELKAGFDADCDNALTCNQPNWVEDRNGGRTEFTYGDLHGGVLTERQPALLNGVRLETRYTYDALSTNDGAIYRLTEMSKCSSISSCAGTDDEVRTQRSYWDSTLLSSTETTIGGGLTITRGFAYNHRGLPTSATDPSGAVTHNTYDLAGQHISSISEDPDGAGPLPRVVQRFAYDAAGRRIREEIGSGNATDGADFNLVRVKRTFYDPVTGRPIKIEEVLP